MIDYLVVGSGLYGATFARLARDAGKTCLVIERRPNIGGNAYTKSIADINVHVYGAHIFHTNNEAVWHFVNRFALFNRYTNCPVANYKGALYALPFNMWTFNKIFGVVTPEAAREKIEEEKKAARMMYGFTSPRNLEESAISLVGTTIYETLVKGYTEKQWGRKCSCLPAFIIKRLPVRFTFDNNYFNALYQGIPIGGYTAMVQRMLEGIEVRLHTDYLTNKEYFNSLARKTIYTGQIDEYFNYKLGALQYRSLRFETEERQIENFQGNAVVNYTDIDTPYTRIIEHKHFEGGTQDATVISYEYPAEWKRGIEPYYPVNDEKNNALYAQYKMLALYQAQQQKGGERVIFGGRLASYKYMDMDKTIAQAMAQFQKEQSSQ